MYCSVSLVGNGRHLFLSISTVRIKISVYYFDLDFDLV